MISSNHKQVWHTIVRGKAHSERVHEIEQYIRDDADAASAKGLTETGKCVPSTKWRADDHASKYCKKYLYQSLKPPVISAKRSYRRRQWWSSSLGWEVFSKSFLAIWHSTTSTHIWFFCAKRKVVPDQLIKNKINLKKKTEQKE